MFGCLWTFSGESRHLLKAHRGSGILISPFRSGTDASEQTKILIGRVACDSSPKNISSEAFPTATMQSLNSHRSRSARPDKKHPGRKRTGRQRWDDAAIMPRSAIPAVDQTGRLVVNVDASRSRRCMYQTRNHHAISFSG